MAKREKPDRELTLKELMQARESLERLWPDLEKTDKWFKYPEKLALHLPDWLLGAGVLVGILLTVYFPHLESIGQILGMLCLGLIIFRFGFERGCLQGFKNALATVQRVIDQEDRSEDGS
jgi:hypothetical protein